MLAKVVNYISALLLDPSEVKQDRFNHSKTSLSKLLPECQDIHISGEYLLMKTDQNTEIDTYLEAIIATYT